MSSGVGFEGGPRTDRALAGVIFDFNGVLWWDEHLQERSWGDFSTRLRGVPLSSGEMAVHVHGRNNRHTLEYLLERRLDEAELAQLAEEKEEIYRRLCLAEDGHNPGDQSSSWGFRLSPGAVELLDRLVDLGIPRTIATASGRSNVDFFVAHLSLDRWFDPAGIVYDDGTLPGKPAPDVYLRAARVLGQPPACCVVIEDSRAGIEAARRAGIGHLIALGPRSSHKALRWLPGVNQVVASLHELLPWPGDALSPAVARSGSAGWEGQ
jgi:beta-phosphoglucomutase-like phosphatase (HAD superfamily)